MSGIPPLAAALGFCYAALLALCLGMVRHFGQLLHRPPAPWQRRLLRGSGWCLLALGFYACVLGWGWSLGPVAWFGLLSAAALVLVFALPYAPRLMLALAPATLLLSLFFLIF